jgi:multiple sugar transport system substrate-binding protein
MFRKLFATLLVVTMVMAALPLTVLAQGGEEVVIRYTNFTAGQDREAELTTIIDAFEAENPGIVIEPLNVPYGDYFTMLQADFVGGDPPDTFELNYENFVAFAANDVLMDMSAYLSEDAPYYQGALEAFQYEGLQYALPETFSTVVLFYNADLFDQAGVDYPNADWTWDDAIEAGTAIRALGEDIWGIHSPIQFWEFYKRAAQFDCEFFNEDRTESLINEPQCIDALETMLSLIELDIMPDPAEMGGLGDAELFENGQLGMAVTGIWMIPAFQEAEANWDIAVEPGQVNDAYHFFSNGISISSTSEHPEEAALWAQFMTSSDVAVQTRLEAEWELPTVSDMSLFEDYLAMSPPNNRQAIFDSLLAPVNPPTIERQAEMQAIFDEMLNAAIAGDMSAEEALNAIKDEIDYLLNE